MSSGVRPYYENSTPERKIAWGIHPKGGAETVGRMGQVVGCRRAGCSTRMMPNCATELVLTVIRPHDTEGRPEAAGSRNTAVSQGGYEMQGGSVSQ